LITLGFSCGHDAGVALLADEAVVFAANEERFTRKKFQSGFPLHSITAAIGAIGGPDAIDLVCLEGMKQSPHGTDQWFRFLDSPNLVNQVAAIRPIAAIFMGSSMGVQTLRRISQLTSLRIRRRWTSDARRLGLKSDVKYADHHTAHAASASMFMSHGNGLAITLDALGEGYCSRAFRVRDQSLTTLGKDVPGYHSPGLLYLYITVLLGFKQGQEGKVTGLAAHGDGRDVERILNQYLFYDSAKGTFRNIKLGFGKNSIKRLQKALVGFQPADIAAGAQSHLEKVTVAYCQDVLRNAKQPSPVLYVAGGVFANVSLNRRLRECLPVDRVVVAPNMGDGGLGMGAALLYHPHKIAFDSLYLGTSIGRVNDLPKVLLDQIEWAIPADLIDQVSSQLANQKTVAVARGRMEYGPRALGNRSIFASASDAHINQILNNRLGRTEFMPFAPIVRDVDCDRYFQLTQPISAYENMTTTCFVTALARQLCPAVVHIDGTARPQIVTRIRNPWIFELLERYEQLTECGVLINTSFNMHEEPIVASSETAVESFLRSRLDVLVLGDAMICPLGLGND
jgi:carbamoyltransferase